MKKRLKELLALCMAGIMMFAMTTGIVSADTTGTASTDLTGKIQKYGYIPDAGVELYPDDIIAPDPAANEDLFEFYFFVVQRVDKAKLTDDEENELKTNVVAKDFMTEDAFSGISGIYKYWSKSSSGKNIDWEEYTVNLYATWNDGAWSWSTVGVEGRNPEPRDFYEYSTNAGHYDGDVKPKEENPSRQAFYVTQGLNSTPGQTSEQSGRPAYALKLPAVNELFGSGYEYGYHYLAQKKVAVPWANEKGVERDDNAPTGIKRVVSGEVDYDKGKVTNTESGMLIDTIYYCKQNDYGLDTGEVKDGLLLEAVPNKYTVNFDANGGTPPTVASKTDVEWKGEVLSDISDPTKEGHFFNGWKCVKVGDTDVTTPIDVNKNTTYGDIMTAYAEQTTDKKVNDRLMNITLQAQWEAKDGYTVKYDTNGGSDVNDAAVKWTDKVTPINNPTKNGFTFKGWNCVKVGDTDITPITVEADATYEDIMKAYAEQTKGDLSAEIKSITLQAQWDKAAAAATGDDTNTILPIALLMLSGIGIACIALNRKKHAK